MEANNIGSHLFCTGCKSMIHKTPKTLLENNKIKCMNCGRILDIPSVKEVIEAVKIKIAPKKKVVKKAKKK